jgi:hypothetical protein
MLKRLFSCKVLFLTLLLLVSISFAQAIYVYRLEYNETVTVGWDAVSDAIHYEIRLVGIKPKNNYVIYPSEQTINIEKVINRPHTGTIKVQVRACNNSNCSEWADSTDPQYATVNGQAMGWNLFWKIRNPTNVILGYLSSIITLFGGKNNG